MKNFLIHLWEWLITCPLIELIRYGDYHMWVGTLGEVTDSEMYCLVCNKKRKYEEEE